MGKRRTLVIDGYNVIRRIPEFERMESRSLEAGRQRLIAVCQAWKARRPELTELVIVFDGDSSVMPQEHQQARNNVKVVFSKSGEKADARILRMVEQGGRHEEFTVVSDDNEITHRSKLLGARTAGVEEFHGWITAAQSRLSKQSCREAPKSALTPTQQRNITEELIRKWGAE